VRAVGEFVVNIVTEENLSAMNASSIEAPPSFNEFEFAGLQLDPSLSVKPPRVRESPIHFECRVKQIIDISDLPGGGSIVIGTIMHIHVEDAMLLGQDKIDLQALKPVGRLMGSGYCRVTDMIELERPRNIIGGKS
jgi:flavin reductase (DIM6/NTAB) family NADH-FMN oxidoreductase RutF